MVKQHAKFVQVSVSTLKADDEDVVMETIVGVDTDGEVWRYIEEDSRWERLSNERFEPDYPGEQEN